MQNNPDILTKDVAEMVGFSDAFYFSRVFKSHEGMSPSQFPEKFLKKDKCIKKKPAYAGFFMYRIIHVRDTLLFLYRFQFVALVYEQRNLNLCTCLNSCRFGSTLCCVSSESWLCLDNLKLYEEWRLDSKYFAIMRANLNHLIILNEFQRISNLLLSKAYLVICLCVHEVV